MGATALMCSGANSASTQRPRIAAVAPVETGLPGTQQTHRVLAMQATYYRNEFI
jgi:hypothetical protein